MKTLILRATNLKFRNRLRWLNLRIRPIRLSITPVFLLTNLGRWRKSGLDDTVWKFPTFSNFPVVGIGAYKGDFLSKRVELEPKKIFFGYEPVDDFLAEAKKHFEGFQNVFLYNYGLAASDKVTQFQLSGDASGLSENPQNAVKVTLKDIANEMVFSNPISLVICNIEGGEYELVNRLVESSRIKNIEVLLLQFHNIDETSRRDMANIRGLLARTHKSEFKYDFIWDAWVRKDLNKEENDSVTL